MQTPYERYQKVYKRHQRGETYKSIAAEMGISAVRARQLALQYESLLTKRAADGSDACVCLTRPPTNYLGNCISCGLPRR